MLNMIPLGKQELRKVFDTPTVSTAFIGYAPTTSPKMAITVTSPDSSWENPNNSYATLVTRRISSRASSAYFNLYPLE